jgi:starch phosphorylase
VPLFYQRNVDNIPRDWIDRMKNSMRRLVPVFNTNRMVREYAEKYYVPAYVRGANLATEGLERSVALAHAKDQYRRQWGKINIGGIHTSGNGHYRVGESVQVDALIDLPEIDPRTVRVQLYAGAVNAAGQIEDAQVAGMEFSREMAPGRYLFSGKIECRTSGRQGFSVRVVPGNPDLVNPFEPGLITWN